MEQVCKICGKDNEDIGNEGESTVLIICENCLSSDHLSPILDRFFLI
jgi:hypothetical protein